MPATVRERVKKILDPAVLGDPSSVEFLVSGKVPAGFDADAACGLGSPLDPSNLTKRYLRPALTKAGIEGTTGFHCLRHTALTAAAAAGLGPHYVQALAGHSSVSIGERYVHLAVSAFPGAAAKTEERLFGAVES